jgi:uncharacterized membrane protein YbhN (UPF0104 family)
VRASGAQPGGVRLSRRVLLSLSSFALVAVAAVAVWPALRSPLEEAARAASRADGRLLLLGGLLFAAAPLGCGLAWRHALNRAGGRLGRVDACARYGVGSLINSFAPGHLGDVARTALLMEALPRGGRRKIVHCFGAIQATRIAALATFVVAASLPPSLVVLVPVLALPAVGILLRLGAWRLVALSLVGPAAKVAAVASVLAALDTPSPLRSALAVVPALELAALVPLTPGNVGVASAAAAIALHSAGLAMADAVEAGLVMHAVETAAGISFGTASALICISQRRSTATRSPNAISTTPVVRPY